MKRSTDSMTTRRLPVGAELQPEGGVHFRVWAPKPKSIRVALVDGRVIELEADEDGHRSALVPEAAVGTRYGFRIDDDPKLFPDPVSRYQPDGVHGPSQVVDPGAFAWTDSAWRGVGLQGQVIYELHIGTFTPAGTWAAASERLPWLAELGVTVVEVLPVADFDGRWGWGYDGVAMFAPTRLYGSPDDMRSFVDRAHALGMGVILDVVYNHFGPSGNYLAQFSSHYMTNKPNEWGECINFDSEDSRSVREFFIANAGYWVEEFHIDGLRLDATHAIVDTSPEHILTAIQRRVRQAAAGRATIVITENDHQTAVQIRPVERGGYGLDGAWNDDFHHICRVAMTGQNDFYYAAFRGSPQELISTARWGYVYQGQWAVHHPRGTPALDIPGWRFVTYLEDHDQVANSARAQHVHELTSPGRHRALTTFWLLAPGTPMFFQGQEFSSTKPFHYFVDHTGELAQAVRKGRGEFMRNFLAMSNLSIEDELTDPSAEATFRACQIDWSEVERHPAAVALHRDLLRLRREDAVFSTQSSERLFGAVLGPESLALRWLGADGDDRLLLLNLGAGLDLMPLPEPLLAAPAGCAWSQIFSSHDIRYGGPGAAAIDTGGSWHLPGHTALVLAARPRTDK